MPRRARIIGFSSLSMVMLLAAVWILCDWPPPRLILKYGLPPTGGPTGRTLTIEGVEFVDLKPGYFRMGSHFLCERGDLLGRICVLLHLPWGKQPRHDSTECPPHWVEFVRGYWIARTEVTNTQYERFNARHERGAWSTTDSGPVTNVSWDDAQAYCAWLAVRAGLSVRLPSEAEWENACRAGSQDEFCFGDNEKELAEYAWFQHAGGPVPSPWGAHPVATRRPNAWGLSDLHGNVDEWCEDLCHRNYCGAPTDGLPWPGTTEGYGERITRGGTFCCPAKYCRSAFRLALGPPIGSQSVGFRPAFYSARSQASEW